MNFVSVLGAFIVLLLGGSSLFFDASDTQTEYPNQNHEIILEINKSSVVLFNSDRSASHYLQKIPFSINVSRYFRFCSTRLQTVAQQYVRFSSFIDSALDVRDVIFPFHSFL